MTKIETSTTAELGFDPEALRRKYREERDKRLRPEGLEQYIDAGNIFPEFHGDPYADPDFTREPVLRDVDTMVLGGGWAGLVMSAALVDAGVEDFLILDQAGDFGGVWYWNRYPGIRCDIESYVYMPLLEEVGTMPTEKYASGAEMLAHAQAIGRHYDLYPRALFQTVLTSIVWDEESSRWIVRTDRDDVIRARFITLGTGPLHRAKLPRIPGIADFGGRSFHSSRWDYSYTGGDWDGGLDRLADKRVALIGTGASSIQILPHLARSAGQVYLFQRTPGAVDARNNRPTDPEWYRSQAPGWQQRRMDNFTYLLSGMQVEEDLVDDCWTDIWHRFGPIGPEGPDLDAMQLIDFQKMEEIRARIESIIEDPDTAEAMKPWYDYFCKRPLYSDEFYQAFNQENVTLVHTDGRMIDRITETGIDFDGHHYDVDLIVYGTGFKAGIYSYEAGGYELRGRGGVDLGTHWGEGMRSLHGMMTSRFPNMFLIGGLEQASVTFNFPYVAARQSAHVAGLISRFLAEGVTSAELTTEGERRWAEELAAAFVDRSAFEAECTPNYFNNEGETGGTRPTLVGGQYGHGALAYLEKVREWGDGDLDRDLELRHS